MQFLKYAMSALLTLVLVAAWAKAETPKLHGGQADIYISTGDNLFLGDSLSFDTPEAVDALFDLLKETGVRRVYWRGLEQVLMNRNPLREQNLRYASWANWTRDLYRRFDPDKAAIAAAHKRGMEIWAVGKLNEFGGQADAVPTNAWPFFESSPLVDKWPVLDRHGVLHQGGTVSFATPESRQDVMDMVMSVMDEYPYDGVAFLSYAENHSQRFQDEFGFNLPIAEEFKKRFGIDPRFEDFTRTASREDWVRLRGEHLSEYLRGLKARLAKNQQNLGLFVNPWDPHEMMAWNVPEMIQTGGPIHIDLEGLLADGTLNQLVLFAGYGASDEMVAKTAQNLLWMTRQTKAEVSIDTSLMTVPQWEPLRKAGAGLVYDIRIAASYFNRAGFPDASLSDLKSDQAFDRMRALQQIAYNQLKATVDEVAPLAKDPNPIVRSLAILALGRMNDSAAFAVVDKALNDPELVVRCYAIKAMRNSPDPQDQIVDKLMASLAGMPLHPVVEETLDVLIGMRPRPATQLSKLMRTDSRPRVSEIAARALESMAQDDLLETYLAGLKDTHEYVRYACTKGLGHLHGNPKAVEALLTQLVKPDDVVVNNRAALALAEIIDENRPEVASLRPRVLETLKGVYAAYGDGCNRPDVAWGYRPTGTALLAFGTQGQEALRQFMLQRKDKQLAELAWKSLCIPHRLSEFDFVTEAQDREAFAQRPPSLRKYKVVRVQQNFESAKPADAQFAGAAGDDWSGLNQDGSHLDAQSPHEGKQSMKLVRGQPAGNLVGVRLPNAIRDGANVQFSLWLRRDSDQSAFGAIALGASGQGIGFFINSSGSLHLWDGEKSGWTITDLTVPAGKWVQLSLVSDYPLHTYTATLTDADGRSQLAEVQGVLPSHADITHLRFSPQGDEGTSSHVDEVTLIALP
jgi:HEAT repeat protein